MVRIKTISYFFCRFEKFAATPTKMDEFERKFIRFWPKILAKQINYLRISRIPTGDSNQQENSKSFCFIAYILCYSLVVNFRSQPHRKWAPRWNRLTIWIGRHYIYDECVSVRLSKIWGLINWENFLLLLPYVDCISLLLLFCLH